MSRFFHATIFLLLLCGCRKDPTVSDVDVRMWEVMDSTGRTLKFFCSTDRIYGCSNYRISHTFERSGDRVEIEFSGIIVPDVCLTSIGPASATVDLGALPDGTYAIDLQVGGNKNEGQLLITPDQYTISIEQPRQLRVTNSPLQRVPSNTIWGTVGYHSSTTAPLVQSFIDSLQLAGAAVQPYHSGDYGYFQIDTNGDISPPQNSGYYFIRPYVMHYTGGSTALNTLVTNYGIHYGDSMNIILYTTRGEVFRSWTH